MWLLQTNDLSLTHVIDKHLETEPGAPGPARTYGILSHRWEADDEEPTFEEYHGKTASLSKIGRKKLEACSQIAQSHGLDLLWSDTC